MKDLLEKIQRLYREGKPIEVTKSEYDAYVDHIASRQGSLVHEFKAGLIANGKPVTYGGRPLQITEEHREIPDN